jgi:NADH-quinone oxidoreductase subunit C
MDIHSLAQKIQEQFPEAVTEKTDGWLVVNKDHWLSLAGALKNGPLAFTSLHSITAVDRRDAVHIVYHLYSFEQQFMATFKVILPEGGLNIDSLTPLWEGANWLEREVYDLFGVRFIGHPDLRRILNPDEWTEHPLRKDFKRDGFIPRPVK